MVKRVYAGCGGSDHGGAMAGGGGLSGSMGTMTMRRNRARGERGDEGGAHGGSDERLGGLGGGLEATGDDGDLGVPALVNLADIA